MTGKNVLSEKINSHYGNNSKQIDVSKFAKGIYFINVSSDNYSAKRKVVIE